MPEEADQVVTAPSGTSDITGTPDLLTTGLDSPDVAGGALPGGPPLLASRLTPPVPPEPVLLRPRLLDRLEQGASGPVTLVCAPAGWGKTTLLSTWAQGERDAETVRAVIREVLAGEPAAVVDYVSLADPDTLAELHGRVTAGAASLAVRIGSPRLLDNTLLAEPDPGLEAPADTGESRA